MRSVGVRPVDSVDDPRVPALATYLPLDLRIPEVWLGRWLFTWKDVHNSHRPGAQNREAPDRSHVR